MTSNELEIFKQSILDDVRVMMQTTGQVTQYIGARYVPLFADPLEWSDTNEYEPLTIVTDKGNTYTSRQFVPKGVSIDDTKFWALTANFNAQIEEYRKEVRKMEGRITAETERAKSAEQTLQTNIDEVSSELGKYTPFDTVPTADSLKGITSGGIYSYIINNTISLPFEYFGGVGDGTTDNYEALIRALSSGYVVILDNKTYRVSKTVSVPANSKLVGKSHKSTIKFDSPTGFTGSSDGKYTLFANCIFNNFKVEGPYNYSNNDTGSTENCGFIGSFFGCVFDNIFISNFETGIQTVQPQFDTGDYEKYLTIYGTVRSITNLGICKCYNGAFLRQSDFYYENLEVLFTRNRGLHVTTAIGTNWHVSGYGAANILEDSQITNFILDAPAPYNPNREFLSYLLQCNEHSTDKSVSILNNLKIINVYSNNSAKTWLYKNPTTPLIHINCNMVMSFTYFDNELANPLMECTKYGLITGVISHNITELSNNATDIVKNAKGLIAIKHNIAALSSKYLYDDTANIVKSSSFI